MSTKKKKTSTITSKEKKSTIDLKPIIHLDEEIFPMVRGYGTGPDVKYPEAFKTIDNLQPEKSAWFLTEHKNAVESIRSRIQKTSTKRYMLKKVDDNKIRIWRIKNNKRKKVNFKPWSEKRRTIYEQKTGKKVIPKSEKVKPLNKIKLEEKENQTNNHQQRT